MSFKHVFSRFCFHIYSLWLFTRSDLKTIVFPQTAFGVLSALSTIPSGNTAFSSEELAIIKRTPLVLLWVWMNLVPFEINNQRQPKDIAEDKLNKPWRTLPSGRWTCRQATYIMFVFYLIAGVLSWYIGGFRWSMSLLLLGIWYNNMGGSDVNALIRNLINALGYMSFGAGALEVVLDAPLCYTGAVMPDLSTVPNLETWIGTMFAIILTTVHTQDMEDQEGDALRGRRSLPLQIGDRLCRWVIASCMIFWGSFCPSLWQCGWAGYITSTLLAYMVALRSLTLRTVESDRTTFKIWNIWIISLYTLPLI
ncbi:UbiA prenyltransferase family [Xylaria longipes]|nr:UbiA prenyltransferase family [Xylaria longipes]